MRARTRYPPSGRLPPYTRWPCHRLADPVYRRRALEFAADAVLAALAFALAFLLRFLDDAGEIPDRYVDDAASARSPSSRSARRWSSSCSACTRSGGATSASRDLWPLLRALRGRQRAAGRWSSCSSSRIADSLPRSVVIFDFILTCALLGGARLARRSIAERPARGAPAAASARACSSSAPARAGRWSSASCS